MKKLITAKVVESLIRDGKTLVVDEDTILTPSAKDMIRNKNVQVNCVTTESHNMKADNNECQCSEEKEECKFDIKKIVEEMSFNGCVASRGNKEEIIEAVIMALDKKGILEKILD